MASAAKNARRCVSSTTAATGASEARAARLTPVPSRSGVETKRYVSPLCSVVPCSPAGNAAPGSSVPEAASVSPSSAIARTSVSSRRRQRVQGVARGLRRAARRRRRVPTVSPSLSITPTDRLAGQVSSPARSRSPASRPTSLFGRNELRAPSARPPVRELAGPVETRRSARRPPGRRRVRRRTPPARRARSGPGACPGCRAPGPLRSRPRPRSRR